MKFADKSVIITGGMSGIGKACAEQFAKQGANILILDININDSEELKSSLKAFGAPLVEVLNCNIAQEQDIINAFDFAKESFGGINIIINVAGMMIYKPITDLEYDDWTKILGVNFIGAAIITREAFRRIENGGAIINVSSIHAHQTSAMVAPYAAAKAALLSLTRSSAIEGKEKNIRVNAILPGAIDTPMLWDSPNIKSGIEILNPDDIGKAINIADAAVFLASEEAEFINGASINIDGGRLIKL